VHARSQHVAQARQGPEQDWICGYFLSGLLPWRQCRHKLREGIACQTVPEYQVTLYVCLADPRCKLQAMGSIHGILPGDKVITNVDVFRKLYEVVGLGWVYAITQIGFINKLANRYVISFHASTSTCRLFIVWPCPRHSTKQFHVSPAGYTHCGLSTDSPSQAALTLKPFCARGKKLAKDPRFSHQT